jgi:hypothetical protein
LCACPVIDDDQSCPFRCLRSSSTSPSCPPLVRAPRLLSPPIGPIHNCGGESAADGPSSMDGLGCGAQGCRTKRRGWS